MKSTSAEIDIPSDVLEKWQNIVDLLAEIIHVPSALVMKVEPPNIKVLISSKSEGNPYERDEVACLDTGLYCETVIKTRQLLLVPDALHEEAWKIEPRHKTGNDLLYGIPCFLARRPGFRNDCVLDNKNNQYSELYRRFLLQRRDVLQADLRALAKLGAELATQKAHLNELFARAPEAIVLVDHLDRGLRVNPEFENIFGYREDEVPGPAAHKPDRAGGASKGSRGSLAPCVAQRRNPHSGNGPKTQEWQTGAGLHGVCSRGAGRWPEFSVLNLPRHHRSPAARGRIEI
jgi:PAS domain-containing protein